MLQARQQVLPHASAHGQPGSACLTALPSAAVCSSQESCSHCTVCTTCGGRPSTCIMQGTTHLRHVKYRPQHMANIGHTKWKHMLPNLVQACIVSCSLPGLTRISTRRRQPVGRAHTNHTSWRRQARRRPTSGCWRCRISCSSSAGRWGRICSVRTAQPAAFPDSCRNASDPGP